MCVRLCVSPCVCLSVCLNVFVFEFVYMCVLVKFNVSHNHATRPCDTKMLILQVWTYFLRNPWQQPPKKDMPSETRQRGCVPSTFHFSSIHVYRIFLLASLLCVYVYIYVLFTDRHQFSRIRIHSSAPVIWRFSRLCGITRWGYRWCRWCFERFFIFCRVYNMQIDRSRRYTTWAIYAGHKLNVSWYLYNVYKGSPISSTIL